MIRLILFVVVGLLAGLGAGTGFKVLRAKSAFAAESVEAAHRAKIVADSLAEHGQTVGTKGAPATLDSAVTSDSATAEPAVEQPNEPVVHTTPSPATTHATPNKAATSKSVAPSVVKAEPNSVVSTPVKGAPKSGAQPAPSDHEPVAGGAATVHAPVTTAATKTDDSAQPKRISKIFASMPARDAAKVLAQMDDADVRLIIGAMTDKQAGAILTNFPADRAAAISKKTMHDGRAP